MKIFGITMLMVAIVSCQTISDKAIIIAFLAYMHSMFDQCLSASGTFDISGSKQDSYSFSGEVDWRIDAKHNFAFEVVNSVGQGLWKIDRDGDLFDVTGLYAAEMPQMSIDGSTNKLLIGRYFSGFLVNEVPCLFKFKLPSKWQDQVVSSETTGKVTSLKLVDNYRNIKIDIDQTKGVQHSQVCTTMDWRHFLGLSKQELVWCFEKLPGKKPRSKATFKLDKFKLTWSTAEG